MGLAIDRIYHGDARNLIREVEPDFIACSIWSPPYYVGKSYEQDMTYQDWVDLLRTVISGHFRVLRPGGFLAINIADILCFPDADMPRIQAQSVSLQKVKITTEDVLQAIARYGTRNRYRLAELLGCSEQTIDRRLKGVNIRGGKYATQTRVKLVGGLLEEMALEAGLYLYDRRAWAKDPAWENSRWHSSSYRAVDDLEYVYIFWKPGEIVVDRSRLSSQEWAEWGSRGIWFIPSVRANNDHEAKFPVELPSRLIRLLTAPGDTVLDCFIGSGTTAVAAVRLARHFVGFELIDKYYRLACKACEAESRKPRLFHGEPKGNGQKTLAEATGHQLALTDAGSRAEIEGYGKSLDAPIRVRILPSGDEAIIHPR